MPEVDSSLINHTCLSLRRLGGLGPSLSLKFAYKKNSNNNKEPLTHSQIALLF
ncbi:hypothetical protein Lalb_Chr18g0050151 [Lupinus albus]|uniref:Uncharacterized protein n=1 Tax=Lupinus albus TaxID=3870 RepID=A0A6A4NKA2_LUPAL|nr:hypothetical protein Lalb_Chr18g0050151 [Lupinus albus]